MFNYTAIECDRAIALAVLSTEVASPTPESIAATPKERKTHDASLWITG